MTFGSDIYITFNELQDSLIFPVGPPYEEQYINLFMTTCKVNDIPFSLGMFTVN